MIYSSWGKVKFFEVLKFSHFFQSDSTSKINKSFTFTALLASQPKSHVPPNGHKRDSHVNYLEGLILRTNAKAANFCTV